MASSTPGSAQPEVRPSAGPYQRAWRRLRGDRLAMVSGCVLLVVALVAYVAPTLIAIDAYKQNLRDALLPPGTDGHPLGTDNFGRDVLLRLIDGGRVSLTVGLIAVALSATVGGLIGLVAGYFGGWPDRILMRLMDVQLGFPGILLALVIITILGSGLEKVTIAVGIGGIPRFARVVRGSVLNTKLDLYVEAARSVGASDARIMFTHLVPQTLGAAITIATFGIATAILAIAGLSFLGLGAQPPTAEWGLMLAEARRYMRAAWWLAVFPSLSIMTVVLCVNLLGDGVRDALDPRIGSASGLD